MCERVPGACTYVGACEVEVVMEIFQWLLHFRVLREGLLLNLELLLSSDWSVSPCPPVSAPQTSGVWLYIGAGNPHSGPCLCSEHFTHRDTIQPVIFFNK